MAVSEAAKEGVYLRRFLDELGLGASSATALATDNKEARDLAYNPEHHEKVKHIERRHFYVRECVENQELIVPFVSTTENMADFFTKPLAASTFYAMRNAIMNVDRGAHALTPARQPSPPASVCGGVSQDRGVRGPTAPHARGG